MFVFVIVQEFFQKDDCCRYYEHACPPKSVNGRIDLSPRAPELYLPSYGVRMYSSYLPLIPTDILKIYVNLGRVKERENTLYYRFLANTRSLLALSAFLLRSRDASSAVIWVQSCPSADRSISPTCTLLATAQSGLT